MTKLVEKELDLKKLLRTFKTPGSIELQGVEVVDSNNSYKYISNGIIALHERFFNPYETEVSTCLKMPKSTQKRTYSTGEPAEDTVYNMFMKNPVYHNYYTHCVSPDYAYNSEVIGELNGFVIIKNYNVYYPIEKTYYNYLQKNGFVLYVVASDKEVLGTKYSKTSTRKYYNTTYAIFHKTRDNAQYYFVQEELPLVDGLLCVRHSKLSVEELDEFVDNYLLNQPYEVQEDYLHAQCRLSFVNSKLEDLYMEKVVGKTGEVGEFLFMQLRTRMSEQEIKEFYRENN